ncbi:MAG: hypothetical protein ACE5JD_03355 [Candidatus Methylomirabilia bacterium]
MITHDRSSLDKHSIKALGNRQRRGVSAIDIQDGEELKRRLDRIAAKARRLHGEPPVPLREVLTDSFVRSHTKYQSWEEMLDQSPFRTQSSQNFTNSRWDAFIRANTKFSSWKEMLKEAAKEMFKRELPELGKRPQGGVQ